MIRSRTVVVDKILEQNDEITEVLISSEDGQKKAINYSRITGPVKVGDKVVTNTNATYLNLGTGGYDFVIANITSPMSNFSSDKGHIIKLRYTPMQVKCLSIEEIDSPYHQIIKDRDSINGMKVIILPLHSMLSPAVHVLKHYNNSLKITYIMTDSACLPLFFSKMVRALKEQQLLDFTITSGQAFGGDLEAVNFYSALLGAKYICECDIAMIGPGPGVVGTNTKLGFSGVEGGSIIDAVNLMNGVPFYVPRISFADQRERHYGVSHHSLTVLGKITCSGAHLAVPIFDEEKENVIFQQINKYQIDQKHDISRVGENTLSILEQRNVQIKTMGRGIEKDPAFFRTVGSTAILALNM